MLTVQQFGEILRQVEYERDAALSDELAGLEDKVWTKMTVASRHAFLVGRFEVLAATERNYAARLSIEPGRQTQAENARVRASELLDIAKRHRAASEQIYEEGAKLRQEANGMLEQQNHQQQQNSSQPAPVARPGRTPPQPGDNPGHNPETAP